jgi:hypothetical protein
MDVGKVFSAVASKVTGALGSALSSFSSATGVGSAWGSWGGWGTGASEGGEGEEPTKETNPEQFISADKLSQHSAFHDPRRKVTKTCVDPSGRISAVVDNFGRVMVIDMSDGTIMRMWKGYRQAQVAWLYCPERWDEQWKGCTPPSHPSQGGSWGLYLVIYALQRGVVELWRMRYGPRVSVFVVGSSCRLLSIAPSPVSPYTRVFLIRRESLENHSAEISEIYLPNSGREVTLKYYSQSANKKDHFHMQRVTSLLRGEASISTEGGNIIDEVCR